MQGQIVIQEPRERLRDGSDRNRKKYKDPYELAKRNYFAQWSYSPHSFIVDFIVD